MQEELADHPPTDHLLVLYFRAQKWWEPPTRRTAFADPADDGEWTSGLPDETE